MQDIWYFGCTFYRCTSHHGNLQTENVEFTNFRRGSFVLRVLEIGWKLMALARIKKFECKIWRRKTTEIKLYLLPREEFVVWWPIKLDLDHLFYNVNTYICTYIHVHTNIWLNTRFNNHLYSSDWVIIHEWKVMIKSLPQKGAILSREYPTPCSSVSCLSPVLLVQFKWRILREREKRRPLFFTVVLLSGFAKPLKLIEAKLKLNKMRFCKFERKKPCQGWRGDQAQWRTSKTLEPEKY